MAKISVILPAYNAEQTIKEAIDSIVNQTFTDWELIIINDGSKDDTEKQILSYNDSRIKYYRNDDNRGLVYTLNRGIGLCTSEYIARMDADDISLPSRFEKQLMYLEEYKLDLIGCETMRTDMDGNIILKRANRSYSPLTITKTLKYDDCIAHPTWFGRKVIFERIGGYRRIHACEDYDFLLRAVKSGVKLGICDSILFIYRENVSGISGLNNYIQKMTSRYLQHNLYRIEEINQEDIKIYCDTVMSKESRIRYEKGLSMLDKGIKELRSKNIIGLFHVLKSVFFSRLIVERLWYLIIITIIRIYYK